MLYGAKNSRQLNSLAQRFFACGQNKI